MRSHHGMVRPRLEAVLSGLTRSYEVLRGLRGLAKRKEAMKCLTVYHAVSSEAS